MVCTEDAFCWGGRSPLSVLTCPSQAKQNAFRFYFNLAAYFKTRLAKAADLRKEKILKQWQLLECQSSMGEMQGYRNNKRQLWGSNIFQRRLGELRTPLWKLGIWEKPSKVSSPPCNGLHEHKMHGQLPLSELTPHIRLTSQPKSTAWKSRAKYPVNDSWVWLYGPQKLLAFSVFLGYLLIFLCHRVPCKATHDLALVGATTVGSSQGSIATRDQACRLLCCQWNSQPFQSDYLQFIPIYLELFLKTCCAIGSVIPHVFYKSRRGFQVLCWKIKALFGGTCGLTIQLDKLSFPCNLNILYQNFNRASLHNYILTL